jgi:tetratricopeptide (TPR) repeat protein
MLLHRLQSRDQLALAIKPLLADGHTQRVLITGLLLSWIGQKFEPALLRAVTERDPYVELRKHEVIAAEIFKLDDNDLEVRSPLFAEYVLREHCAPDDVLTVIEKLIVVAVRRKRERGFQGILSKLMRIAMLKTMIVGVKGLDTIESLFQNLQRDIEVNKEPLFWLQYAILESEMKNFSEAESFLETAYKRAENSAAFQTFQIDTYALRLLLRIEELNVSRDVSRFEQILDKSELVLSMITDQNHRFRAIQVLEGFEPFVKARAVVMSVSERNAMVFQLGRLEAALGALSSEIRAETGSDFIKRSLAVAREHIVKLSS